MRVPVHPKRVPITKVPERTCRATVSPQRYCGGWIGGAADAARSAASASSRRSQLRPAMSFAGAGAAAAAPAPLSAPPPLSGTHRSPAARGPSTTGTERVTNSIDSSSGGLWGPTLLSPSSSLVAGSGATSRSLPSAMAARQRL